MAFIHAGNYIILHVYYIYLMFICYIKINFRIDGCTFTASHVKERSYHEAKCQLEYAGDSPLFNCRGNGCYASFREPASRYAHENTCKKIPVYGQASKKTKVEEEAEVEADVDKPAVSVTHCPNAVRGCTFVYSADSRSHLRHCEFKAERKRKFTNSLDESTISLGEGEAEEEENSSIVESIEDKSTELSTNTLEDSISGATTRRTKRRKVDEDDESVMAQTGSGPATFSATLDRPISLVQ
jgi:hypothetical protein